MSARKRQQGFTLIEVLVSLMILAIGLLGLTGLQTVSLRNSYAAYQRTQAMTFSHGMLDRMRVNSDQAKAGAYDIDYEEDPADQDCESADCTEAQMVNFDLTEWKTMLDLKLPNGDGSIEVGDDERVIIRVRWNDEIDPAQMLQVSMESQL